MSMGVMDMYIHDIVLSPSVYVCVMKGGAKYGDNRPANGYAIRLTPAVQCGLYGECVISKMNISYNRRCGMYVTCVCMLM